MFRVRLNQSVQDVIGLTRRGARFQRSVSGFRARHFQIYDEVTSRVPALSPQSLCQVVRNVG